MHIFSSLIPRLIRGAAIKLQTLVQSGVAKHEAWNESSVQLAQAAMVGNNLVASPH